MGSPAHDIDTVQQIFEEYHYVRWCSRIGVRVIMKYINAQNNINLDWNRLTLITLGTFVYGDSQLSDVCIYYIVLSAHNYCTISSRSISIRTLWKDKKINKICILHNSFKQNLSMWERNLLLCFNLGKAKAKVLLWGFDDVSPKPIIFMKLIPRNWYILIILRKRIFIG